MLKNVKEKEEEEIDVAALTSVTNFLNLVSTSSPPLVLKKLFSVSVISSGDSKFFTLS